MVEPNRREEWMPIGNCLSRDDVGGFEAALYMLNYDPNLVANGWFDEYVDRLIGRENIPADLDLYHHRLEEIQLYDGVRAHLDEFIAEYPVFLEVRHWLLQDMLDWADSNGWDLPNGFSVADDNEEVNNGEENGRGQVDMPSADGAQAATTVVVVESNADGDAQTEEAEFKNFIYDRVLNGDYSKPCETHIYTTKNFSQIVQEIGKNIRHPLAIKIQEHYRISVKSRPTICARFLDLFFRWKSDPPRKNGEKGERGPSGARPTKSAERWARIFSDSNN